MQTQERDYSMKASYMLHLQDMVTRSLKMRMALILLYDRQRGRWADNANTDERALQGAPHLSKPGFSGESRYVGKKPKSTRLN